MPDDETTAQDDDPKVEISAAQYKSLILQKLQAEIKAQRARFDLVQNLKPEDLGNMAYWKMKYWKMKYWKMGSQLNPEDMVINPAIQDMDVNPEIEGRQG